MQHQTTEASELGLKPGEWPATLGDGFWIKSPFVRRSAEGEILSVSYEHGSQTLEVFND